MFPSSLYITFKSASEAIFGFSWGILSFFCRFSWGILGFLGVFCLMLSWQSLSTPQLNHGRKHKYLLPKWTKHKSPLNLIWWWGRPNFLTQEMRKMFLAPSRAMKRNDSYTFITHTSKLSDWAIKPCLSDAVWKTRFDTISQHSWTLTITI